MTDPSKRQRRPAAATVELALLLPFLVVVILGIWEVGRMVQVQQIMNNAAREGARLAAQGLIINKDDVATLINVTTGTPNVKDAVKNYLREAGIDTTNLDVQFQYISGNTANTQPYQATKGQRFRITVKIPFNNVRWVLLGLTNQTELVSVVEWHSLVDDPFTLNTTIPTW